MRIKNVKLQYDWSVYKTTYLPSLYFSLGFAGVIKLVNSLYAAGPTMNEAFGIGIPNASFLHRHTAARA